jgi:hypothetical protein
VILRDGSAGHASSLVVHDVWRSAVASREVAANRPQSIRAKIGAWRAAMSRNRVSREKFFCCQNLDSESVRLASGRILQCLATSVAQTSSISRITNTTCVLAFAAFLQGKHRSLWRIFCVNMRSLRRRFDHRARRAHGEWRQHFLKREAVFFVVLVYSGCSASRFPSARSD